MPKINLHTAVKRQFGLETSRTMSKTLKKAMFLSHIYKKKKAPVTVLTAPSTESLQTTERYVEAPLLKMYQDRRETGTTLCFIRMLPFVAVKTVLAILAI